MRKRTCFLCSKTLSFDDYIATNISVEEFILYTKIVEKDQLCKIEFNKKFKKFELVKIWKSDKIELFCCHCKRFLERLAIEHNTLWQLLEWANDKRLDKLKQLGILTQKQLVDIKNKK